MSHIKLSFCYLVAYLQSYFKGIRWNCQPVSWIASIVLLWWIICNNPEINLLSIFGLWQPLPVSSRLLAPTQTVTGLMSGRSGFLEVLLQVNKFWAICFHTAPFHYQVPPPLSLDLYLINFPLSASLCAHIQTGEREVGREREDRESERGERKICLTWCFEAK